MGGLEAFFIRVMRLAGGALVFVIALSIGGYALDQLGTPFAGSSVLTIVSGLFWAWAAVMLMWGAAKLAFGSRSKK